MTPADMHPDTPMTLAEIAVERHGAAQDPWELGTMLEIVSRVIRPKLVFEVGSWKGGSLYAWAAIGADVVAVTLPETRDWLNDGHSYGAQIIYGNSHDDAMRDRILTVLAGRVPDLAFIDGDHSEAGCRADWELCKGLGIPVIALHDVLADGDPGVRKVWAEVCARYPHVLIERPKMMAPVGAGIAWLT